MMVRQRPRRTTYVPPEPTGLREYLARTDEIGVYEPDPKFAVVVMERDTNGDEWLVEELDRFDTEADALDAADNLNVGLRRGHWAEVRRTVHA